MKWVRKTVLIFFSMVVNDQPTLMNMIRGIKNKNTNKPDQWNERIAGARYAAGCC